MTAEKPTLKIALMGQPNVGKSTVFNMFTGLDQHVGNWPGKTVEYKEGSIQFDNTEIKIVDLPGTYSLTANSEEEKIARDFIIHEQPDLVIVIVNAASLERNLYLVTELLVLDVPIVMGLNMMDVADQQGFKIDVELLETALGFPVVPIIARRNIGLKKLIKTSERLAQNPSEFSPHRPEFPPEFKNIYEEVCSLINGRINSHYLTNWVAIKLLEGDREVLEKVKQSVPDVWREIEQILVENEDAILAITQSRYEWIERMVRIALIRPKAGKIVLTDRLDRVATHPFWGLLMLIAVFGLVFFLTYWVATPIVEWMQLNLVIPSADFMMDVLQDSPEWFSGLVVDGIIGGVGTVLTFLPILVLFFMILGILEDVGYLARAAFVMDRFMHIMGLHGRSFLPMFIGFGCNVPAVLGTRIIEDKRARLLTILLIPLVPCTARMAVVAFLAPAFFGQQAALVTWLLVIINLLTLLVLGFIINRAVFKGVHSPFIMEIPLYHVPNARTIGLYVWHNTFAFIKKAGGLIVFFSVIVWLFSYLPNGDLQSSYLADFGRWLLPLGRLMGLTDWRLIMALLTSFIAKENTIATLGILYGVQEESQVLSMRIASTINPAGAFAFLLVQMLFIPCVATVAVVKQETNSWKFTLVDVLLLLFISLAAGIGAYQIISLFPLA
jgi:ferrous iron transport protein B